MTYVVAALIFLLALLVTGEFSWLARRFADFVARAAIWVSPEASRTSTWLATVRDARNDGGNGVSPALGYLCQALALRFWASRRLLATVLRGAAGCCFIAVAVMSVVRPHATPHAGLPSGLGGALAMFGLALVALAESLHPKMVVGRGASRGGPDKGVVLSTTVAIDASSTMSVQNAPPSGTSPGVGGATATLGGVGGMSAHGAARAGGSASLGLVGGLSAHAVLRVDASASL
jgi:hypothetical protein